MDDLPVKGARLDRKQSRKLYAHMTQIGEGITVGDNCGMPLGELDSTVLVVFSDDKVHIHEHPFVVTNEFPEDADFSDPLYPFCRVGACVRMGSSFCAR